MSERRTIELAVTLDGRLLASETTCMWAGPYVLTIATTLPDHGLAVELHSTFVGHEPVIAQVEHDRANLDPMLRARECAYEHVQVLLETLKSLDYEVAIDVPDDAFKDLERIEP
jgi:hypothetical protein